MARIDTWLAKPSAWRPVATISPSKCCVPPPDQGLQRNHARGLSKYDRVLSALPLIERRDDGAAWLRRLREAAMQDEDGGGLDGVLATIREL